MQKAIVIGSPGAGKSVFAKKLSDKTGLPLIHLDMVWHKPDRTTISREELDCFLEKTFKETAWIIDGNYVRTLEVRMKNADTVFFLDYPVEVCLAGIKERVGKERSDMPWVENTLDEEFRSFVEEYPKEQTPIVYELLEKYKEGRTIVIFKAREEAEKYLEEQ